MGKEKSTTDNIPDIKGQIAIITGANTGLVKETAKALASKKATVILVYFPFLILFLPRNPLWVL